MTPYFEADGVTLYHGDALPVLGELPDASVEAVITDPPAGISFMGRAWDHHRGGREQWSGWLAEVMAECLRVAKPGAHAVVWALPRTSHWTACGLEDAGWEIRDRITHLFASGFPKSLDVSKAIDKRPGVQRHRDFASHLAERRAAAGLSRADVSERVVGTRTGACWNWEHHQFPEAKWWPALRDLLGLDPAWGAVVAEAERAVVGTETAARFAVAPGQGEDRSTVTLDITAPATASARRWSGWGTALKPAAEDWWLCRKPFPGSVASNVLAYGTGALNVDACRVGTDGGTRDPGYDSRSPATVSAYGNGLNGRSIERVDGLGRWPTHLVLSHAATPAGEDLCVDGCVQGCPVAELDRQSGVQRDGVAVNRNREPGTRSSWYGTRASQIGADVTYGGDGGASRYFPVFRYQAKAPTSERPKVDGKGHETVKPLDLMRWLVRLVTPPGGLVLDPFAGSGTTGEACIIEGFRCLLVEREAEHLPKIVARLSKPIQPVLEVPCA